MTVRPQPSMAQNKLWVLYLLKQSEMELSELQIMRICDELDVIGYFDLVECLFELTQNGHIYQKNLPQGVAYGITEKGAEIINVMRNDLRLSLRHAVDDYLKQHKTALLKESQFIGEYLKLRDNEYRVTLRVLEKNETIFEINIIVSAKAEAQAMVEKWTENAVEIYKEVILKLS
ncbi:DUF4364 family protein [Christensenellaceae bacterium OttesenSCG-928-K19]|nr:DUF4364 family protein [Christensenellaceae bacterium OttesenSCG-928-K19]